VVFSDPEMAMVGSHYEQLKNTHRSFVVGKADFQQQSRAMLEQRNTGLLHLYADRNSAHILGAELVCPDAEHLAHHLAMAIQYQLTVFDVLLLPYYHPTVEEALRTALQDAANQLREKGPRGLSLCGSCPEPPLW
jgi:dihydrolipoamide dehydrogenase